MNATKKRDENHRLQADWAARGWCKTVSTALGILTDSRAVRQLGFHVADPDTATQQADAETMFRLVVGTASQRAWSMSIHDLPPRQFAGVLGQNAHAAIQRMDCDESHPPC